MIKRFGQAGVAPGQISMVKDTYWFNAPDKGPADVIDLFKNYYGPTMNAFAAAQKSGSADFIDYWMGAGAWAAMPEARRGPVAESMRPIRQWTDAISAEPWSLADLAGLSVPTLLLGGEISPASARDLLPLLAGALAQAELRVLPDLGHMAPAIQPQAVNPLIAGFLHSQA